jgi:hypothetical protein
MMYASYIMRRTQIYLDEEQARALSKRAARQGVTASHVIREAVDAYLARPEDEDERRTRYRAALQASFGSLPHLPNGVTFVEHIRRADEARERELEERRRR